MSNKRDNSLSVQTAQAIIREITAKGWPNGECIGSEQELMKRHGVGQASLREAARILEVQGIAAMHRGKGLLVASDPKTAAIRTLSIYIGLLGSSVGEVLEVRTVLGKLMSVLTAQRITQEEKDRIAQKLKEMHGSTNLERMIIYSDLGKLTVEATKNPLLVLFQGAIDDFLPAETRFVEAVRHYDRVISGFSAMTAGKGDISASYVNEVVLDEIGQDTRRLAIRRPFYGQSTVAHEKLAMTIASALAMDITIAEMSPGDRLGTEASLASYYGVARSTLRSAIKILSLHGRVKVQRGVRGGLAVASLSPEFTLDLANQCLSRMNIEESYAAEAAGAFEAIRDSGNSISDLFLSFINGLPGRSRRPNDALLAADQEM